MTTCFTAAPGVDEMATTADIPARRLTAVKPPAYDNPINTRLVHDRSGVLFSSDCFAA
jgi:hypothetical protein